MFVCCYYDTHNNNHFEIVENIETFTDNHPGITPAYIFDMASECQMFEQIQKSEFEKYASLFGFTENDYKARLLTNSTSSEECELVGFLPHNTKYKCQVVRIPDGHRYKMTPGYVRECIIRHANAKAVGFD